MTLTTIESDSATAVGTLPSLEELWMPFTANRAFKRAPRMLVAAKDMHYTTADGRQILDGTAGLWCVNAGHCRESITAAIREQAGVMDYAPPDIGPASRPVATSRARMGGLRGASFRSSSRDSTSAFNSAGACGCWLGADNFANRSLGDASASGLATSFDA